MADETKTPDLPETASSGAGPEPIASEPAAQPAVHSDVMWGGPRFVHNARGEPVWCETKADYFALLNAEGLRMKDQQESSTGPDREIAAPAPLPDIVVPPMSQDEAHIYGAWIAVKKRYMLTEALWCDDCFARNRHHGVRLIVAKAQVSIECRCGRAAYHVPKGTTDIVTNALATTAVTALDRTMGAVAFGGGAPIMIPTWTLNDVENALVRRYILTVRRRHKTPLLFHESCYLGDPRNEDNALAINIDDSRLIMVCRCRQLFHQQKRVGVLTH